MDDEKPLPFPRRTPLPDQVVAFLRQGIVARRWGQALPSENQLCRELKVSRVTLRKAIEQLAREEWIERGGRGRQHRIRQSGAKSVASVQGRGRIVRLLTPYHPREWEGSHQQLRRSLSERIGGAGYWIEVEHRPRLFEQFREEELVRLDEQPDTAGWILCFSTEPLQRWFEGRKRPAVLLGPRHPGVSHLSSVYPDTEAVARHALGLLVARGHSHIAYLMDEFTSLGDRRCAAEFSRIAAGQGQRVDVVNHQRSRESVCRAMNHLLASRPAPTAFFSCCPEHCITILCHLQGAGIRVPDGASLVCGWDDSVLDFTVPSITRYQVDGGALGRKLGDLLLDQFQHGVGKTRVIGLTPTLVPGGSVGPRR